MIHEQRENLRLEREEPVKVDVLQDEESPQPMVFECLSKDLSSGGIRLHGNQVMLVGSMLNLTVHLQKEKMSFNLFGSVKWTTSTTEDEHVYGVELMESNPSDFAQWRELFET